MTGLSLAAEDEPLEVAEELDGTQSNLCGQTLHAEGGALIAQYQNFLDLQTKDAADNSDRLETIMSYYRYVVYTLENRFQALSQEDISGESFGSSNEEYDYCYSILQQYLLVADSMLRTYYISSTGSKVTFKVVDGLKSMNESLQGMSQSYHATFPGMFNKFSNALPCYVNSCVGK